MSNNAAIDCLLPALDGHVASVSFSGCCAIFNGTALVGNGALLWTGKHIITAARVVDGLTPSDDIHIRFNTELAYTVPSIQAITVHPNYDHTTKFYDHNMAIITLASEVTSSLSRYVPYLQSDMLLQRFSRCVYGRTMDPATGNYDTI